MRSAPITANGITLQPGCSAQVEDGARVALTFHVFSGATAMYDVTTSGNRVAGTTS